MEPEPTPAQVAADLGLVSLTEITGPVTVLLTGGTARPGGMAWVPLPGDITLTLPCSNEMVTVLPGRDAIEVLRAALGDAILVAQDVGDERGERAYLRILDSLEGPLPYRG